MLIAVCPKCSVPIWRGELGDIPETDVKCWICETDVDIAKCRKFDPVEWREAFLTDESLVQARNIFHTNMRAVAEKMDLPTYFAEWGLLTLADLEAGRKGEVSKIFQEEIRCLMENLIRRLAKRAASTAS